MKSEHGFADRWFNNWVIGFGSGLEGASTRSSVRLEPGSDAGDKLRIALAHQMGHGWLGYSAGA